MPLRAGLAEIDITPRSLPIEKSGWIVRILADRIDDPIFGKVLVIESGGTRIGFVSLDVLSIRWPEVDRIREIGVSLGIPKENLTVAATHTHTAPSVSSPGLARRDEQYVDFMVARVGEALHRAIESLAPARIAIDSMIEARISSIRRAIMKDGSVRTHAPPSSAIRCLESVIDPEVGVLCVKDSRDRIIGMLVNFTCHPVHKGGGTAISAGWPGVLSNTIKNSLGSDCVVAFVNGALGDAHHQSCLIPDYVDTKENVGKTVAETVLKLLQAMKFTDDVWLSSAVTTIKVPLRDIDGPFGVNMKNRQRFAPDETYETLIARLRAKKAKRDHVLAQVQCLRIGDVAFVSLPCEPFTAIGLEIKSRSPFAKTYVIGVANGMIGYVPTESAFTRGGYECTLSMGSKLDPSAARMVIEAAVETLNVVDKSDSSNPSVRQPA